MSEINRAERRAAIARVHFDLQPYMPVGSRYPSLEHIQQMSVMFRHRPRVVAVDSIGVQRLHPFIQTPRYTSEIQGPIDRTDRNPDELESIVRLRIASQRLAAARRLGGLHIITDEVFDGISPGTQANLLDHFTGLNQDVDSPNKVSWCHDSAGWLPSALSSLDLLRTEHAGTGVYAEYRYEPMNSNNPTVVRETNMPPGDSDTQAFVELFDRVQSSALSIGDSTRVFKAKLDRL